LDQLDITKANLRMRCARHAGAGASASSAKAREPYFEVTLNTPRTLTFSLRFAVASQIEVIGSTVAELPPARGTREGDVGDSEPIQDVHDATRHPPEGVFQDVERLWPSCRHTPLFGELDALL
jgi:hypothetical protein